MRNPSKVVDIFKESAKRYHHRISLKRKRLMLKRLTREIQKREGIIKMPDGAGLSGLLVLIRRRIKMLRVAIRQSDETLSGHQQLWFAHGG
ncbi:hypothetical protein KCP74_24180 [Salmonella enterica subsp. enterica]|nr:hypothetical protein KCP74_24180 [Salmonella enterica subsp. enterica]